MCGIFGYLNFATPKKRNEIIEILLQGLRRMEYRGYDSAGKSLYNTFFIINVFPSFFRYRY